MEQNGLRTRLIAVVILALVSVAGDKQHGALVTIGKNGFRSDLSGFADEIGLGQRENYAAGRYSPPDLIRGESQSCLETHYSFIAPTSGT